MSSETNRTAVVNRNSCETDAGVVGIAHQLRALPSAELLAHAEQLVHLPEPLATIARTRLRLALAELGRRDPRQQRGERAA